MMPMYGSAHGSDASLQRLAAIVSMPLDDVIDSVRRDLSALRRR